MKSLSLLRTCLVPCCICLSLLSSRCLAEPVPAGLRELTVQPAPAGPFAALSLQFNDLNTRIRDNRIGRADAKTELKRLLAELRAEYRRAGARDYPPAEWVFPLSGYDSRAIGGGRRHGYVSSSYDYFKGNRHGGHPSFDIFIRDRNRDSRDDRSGRPVSVVSLTGGVVVALEREWQTDSRLLGGRYLWVYDPANEMLVYYAHSAELFVDLGDSVKPGDLLGSVGRSGYNAAKRRSPTHLHLTVLDVRDGRAVPLDVYRELKGARLSAGR